MASGTLLCGSSIRVDHCEYLFTAFEVVVIRKDTFLAFECIHVGIDLAVFDASHVCNGDQCVRPVLNRPDDQLCG